jgi:plasmid stability protein
MEEITIRNLDEGVVRQLRALAWKEGVPVEEALRRLLAEVTQRRMPIYADPRFPASTD